jgi:hypothetical protein
MLLGEACFLVGEFLLFFDDTDDIDRAGDDLVGDLTLRPPFSI